MSEFVQARRYLARRIDALAAERDQALAELAEAREALRAIQANAEAWHGPPTDEPRRAAALTVIARWAQDPASIPDGVREHVRVALAAVVSASPNGNE